MFMYKNKYVHDQLKLRPYFLPWVSKNRLYVSMIQSLFLIVFNLNFTFSLKVWLQFTQNLNLNLKKEQRYGVKQLFLFLFLCI